MDEIYTWLKDGEPRGFAKTERDLLIGYDMMPLMGLDKMRDELNREGKIARGRLVETDGKNAVKVAFRHGEPDIAAIDYGCSARRTSHLGTSAHDCCLRTLCMYVSPVLGLTDYKRFADFEMSDESHALLRDFYWRVLSDDGRRRRPLARLRPQVEAALAELGFDVRGVKFVEGES